jgi:hypothetical protein
MTVRTLYLGFRKVQAARARSDPSGTTRPTSDVSYVVPLVLGISILELDATSAQVQNIGTTYRKLQQEFPKLLRNLHIL